MTTADSQVTVTQADRDAAAQYCAGQPFAADFVAGRDDAHPLVQSHARHRLAAEKRERAWRPTSEAPYNEEVQVRAASMTFLAMLVPNASMNGAEQSCDQWQATREGEHPPCWSDGGCWESNEDEVMSLQPDAWRPA